jgi:hypothetical protein
MRLSLLIVAMLMQSFPSAHGATFFGLETNSSNNMLLRPDAASGTMTSMVAGLSRSVGDVSLAYSGIGGALEQYDGLQYHFHRISASYEFPTINGWNMGTDLSARMARYGEVSLFDRMSEVTLHGQAKRYLAPTLLFRWEGSIGRRTYTPFETESATSAETLLRLDRFFGTGTTLRGQLDLGIRSYNEVDGSPGARYAGVRIRTAQSLGPLWGMWIELNARDITSDKSSAETISTDRVFLDDHFTYSSKSATLHMKRIFTYATVDIGIRHTERKYEEMLSETYSYLPADGWKEREWDGTLSVGLQMPFLPTLVHPSIEAYVRDVNASVSYLSYDATGVAFRIYYY